MKWKDIQKIVKNVHVFKQLRIDAWTNVERKVIANLDIWMEKTWEIFMEESNSKNVELKKMQELF